MRTPLAALLLVFIPLCGCEPHKATVEPDEATPISIPGQGDDSADDSTGSPLPPPPQPMPSPRPSPVPFVFGDAGAATDHADTGPSTGSEPSPDAGGPES